MPDIAEIRAAMAAALAREDMQVSAYMLSNPTPPAIWLWPEEIDYDQTMGRGHDDVFFTVQAVVGVVSDIGAQVTLDKMLAPSGSESVKALLETRPVSTLGGLVDNITVEGMAGYRQYATPSGGAVLGAEWRVHVMADGR